MRVEIYTPSGWKLVADATLQDLALDSFRVILPLSTEVDPGRIPALRIRIDGREAVDVALDEVESLPDGGSLVAYHVLL
jgi:hypothetical protein